LQITDKNEWGERKGRGQSLEINTLVHRDPEGKKARKGLAWPPPTVSRGLGKEDKGL